MSTNKTISLKVDGPLIVNKSAKIIDEQGAELEPKDVVALCRCGASKRKPFCDGSHSEAGFSSKPDHSEIRNKEIEYVGNIENNEVTISYTPVLCSHAGECARLAKNVFDPTRKPWIQPENGTLTDVLSVVAACPSGALRMSTEQFPAQHLTSPELEIRIEAHGPYWVKNITLEAEFNGVGACQSKYVLCRCGHSKNKPFCDGTHYDVKWRDDE